jgi:hypothetical protein
LVAAEVAIVEFGFVAGNCLLAADDWDSGESALCRAGEKNYWGLPDADGEDARLGGAEGDGKAQRGVEMLIPDGIWWKLADGADEGAVPVDFAGAVAGRKEEGEVEGSGRVGREDETAAVPGVAGVTVMALGFPGAAGEDGLPGGVVE